MRVRAPPRLLSYGNEFRSVQISLFFECSTFGFSVRRRYRPGVSVMDRVLPGYTYEGNAERMSDVCNRFTLELLSTNRKRLLELMKT